MRAASQEQTVTEATVKIRREKARRVTAADLWWTVLYHDYQQTKVLLSEPRFLLGYSSKLRSKVGSKSSTVF